MIFSDRFLSKSFFLLFFSLFILPCNLFASAAIQQKQMAERRAIAQRQRMQQAAQQQAVAQQNPSSRLNSQQSYNNVYVPRVQVEDVTDLNDIWARLDYSSEIWVNMIDEEPKVLTVEKCINLYAQQDIFIRKPARHYVQMIDSMARENPSILSNKFKDIMRFVAILEYDFDNGQDKDALARLLLKDENSFRANRERLGVK